MLPGYSPVTQALLGTLFTWGLTAAGACLLTVTSFLLRPQLMLAVSYWSLLAPAIDMAEDSGKYGSFAFVPVAVGVALGAAFVYLVDLMMPALGVGVDPHIALALPPGSKLAKEEDPLAGPLSEKLENGGDVYQRRKGPYADAGSSDSEGQEVGSRQQDGAGQTGSSWRRIVLLILAITIHNIPEGLAVGVGFGAIGKTSSATLESARNLAIGIGIQNFPEGLAVSLPLRGAGMSTWKAFWYGQLSGMVEPIAGLLGAVAVVLSFAAGAMVYVVVDDIIPEAQLSGNGKLASWTSILGFVVMMSLDVGLG
uniref:Zinc transporter ZIP11 n=1 Tax=Oncorhynchus mykiss TaxID=8022 RepID=A0A8C7WGV1_ONCMY